MSKPDFEKILDNLKLHKPSASIGAYDNFLDSTLYMDFRNELIARIEQMRDIYETCSSKQYLEVRGGIAALRLLSNIFKDLRNNVIADLESATKENDDDKEV